MLPGSCCPAPPTMVRPFPPTALCELRSPVTQCQVSLDTEPTTLDHESLLRTKALSGSCSFLRTKMYPDSEPWAGG